MAEIKARSMTRKERKEFLKSGLDPAFVKKTGDDAADNLAMTEISEKMIDWILEHIYPDQNFDNVSNAECIKLARDTYALTMGADPETLKNL